LITALILDRELKGRNIARTVIFLPTVICTIVAGFIWTYIYEPNNGFLNVALRTAGLGKLEFNWLGDPSIVMFSLVVVYVWLTAGIRMVIYLAGLQTIPIELIESSFIEGCNSIQRFKHITWPLLAPALTINVLIVLIWGLQEFSLVYVMTGGRACIYVEYDSNLCLSNRFQIGKLWDGYGIFADNADNDLCCIFVCNDNIEKTRG